MCQAPNCNKVPNEGPTPPVISDIFQTKIEMKNLLANTTMEIEMWYEFEQQLARFNTLQDSQAYDIYYSFKTQEIFVITPRELQCMVFNMSQGGDFDLIVGKNVNGKTVPNSPTSIFRLNPELGIKHMGSNYTIRGIAADRWYSCQNWPERKADLEINWYFSRPGWSSVIPAPVPLLIEVKGVINDTINGTRPFSLMYDFMQFRNYLQSPDSVFQTPRGVYCQGRAKTKRLPDLHPIMSYTWEVVSGRSEAIDSIYYGRIDYDSVQGVVRYDYREPGSFLKPPYFNLGTLTVVQDFNTGVSYYIDGVLGNCTDKAIGSDFIDTKDLDIKDSPGWHLVELRNPKSLFNFDNSYQYEGRGMVRGLPVDIFISVREIQISGLPINVTYEYYILDESVTEIAIGKGHVGLGKSIPVELRMVSYTELGPDADPGFSYFNRFNFFNFDVADPDSQTGTDFDQVQPFKFDIGPCFTKEERLNFVLKFIAVNNTIAPKNMNMTELFVRSAIKQLGSSDMGLVNPIRFQSPKLDYDSKFLYLTVTLLDKPHLYSQFIRVSDAKNPTLLKVDSSAELKTEAECIDSCNTAVSTGCNSVAFCSGPNVPQKNCFYSVAFGYAKNMEAYTCRVFIRPTNSSSRVTELGLEEAWSTMSSVVGSGLFNVPLMTLDGKDHVFRAVSVERFEIRGDVYNPLRGRHLQQFDAIERLSLRNPKRQVENKVSADDCALACLEETEFKCQSVTYCYDLGVCYLSEDVPDAGRTNTLDRARCNIYVKNELAKYRQFLGISRIYNTGKRPSGRVDKADKCALMCQQSPTNATFGGCRSFDVCTVGGQQLCYLDSGHLTDGTGISGNRSECTHYSRSFTVDFARSTSLINPDFQDQKLFAGLTEDRCARKCVEEFGAACQGYYFCNSTGDCAVLTVGGQEARGSTGSGPKCDYLKRLYNPDGTKYQITKPQTGPATKIGLTAGAAAAIFILTALLGLVIGQAILISILHKRGNPIWNRMKAFFTRR